MLHFNALLAIDWMIRDFNLGHHVYVSSGPHPSPYGMCTRVVLLGAKQLECEADHLPHSSPKIERVQHIHIPCMLLLCIA
jgi:hypothetical protein